MLIPREHSTKPYRRGRGRAPAARGKLTLASLIWPLALGIFPATADGAEPCPSSPPAIRELDLQRFYADDAGSIVDERKAEGHKAATRPLTEFLRHVTADADKAWKRSKADERAQAGRCAAQWLDTWAAGGALLGRMGSKQAEYQRKWDLAGAALAYIKVKPYASAEQKVRIEAWLSQLADACLSFFDDRDRKRNNHWYWMGLAEGATAVATGGEKHWKAARQIMTDAASDIAADGTLSHELDRKARALHYHAFAAMPLITLAELMAARGEDAYALNDGALHRLAQATLAGLANPETFTKLVGEKQEQPVNPGAGWLQLYAARFPSRIRSVLPAAQSRHRWLGGDVAILKEALAASR